MIEISIQFMCLRIVSTYLHVHTCAQVCVYYCLATRVFRMGKLGYGGEFIDDHKRYRQGCT